MRNVENRSGHALSDDLELIRHCATKAGQIAFSYFGNPGKITQKSGNSPVSEADLAVDDFLKKTLLEARPDYGWLSEETADDKTRLECSHVFIVDPIDGTRGFIAGHKQWCISIALVSDDHPVAGVLECPALDESFYASSGNGAFCNGKMIRAATDKKVSTITSSKKINEMLEASPSTQDCALTILPFVPSLAYRLAMVADGRLDAAIARPGAHEWDLAAADIILCEAGGVLCDQTGASLRYNKAKSGFGSVLASGKNCYDDLWRLAKSGGFLQ